MTVIAISSFAAASAVGLGIIAPALHAQGLEVIAVPTVTLGRHPGWGPPGGGPTPDAMFASLLEGAAAHPLAAEAHWVLSGYVASPAQVAAIAAFVSALKRARPALGYVCDPVMGDAPKGLYVPEEAAQAVAQRLVPLADVVTPNAWEAARLTGRPVTTAAEARAAAETLSVDGRGRARLAAVTSTPLPATAEPEAARLGVTLAGREGAWLASAPERLGPADARAQVSVGGRRSAGGGAVNGAVGGVVGGVVSGAWGGAGDLFAALLLAGLETGLAAPDALARAVGGVDAVLHASQGRPELVRGGLARTLGDAAPADLAPLA